MCSRRFLILDPANTFSVPRDQTVYGIVDSMSHALEHYFHRTENTPMIDGFIESLLRTAIQTGPKLLEDLTSFKHRETMMYISTTAFNETLANGTDGGDWATHRIEHLPYPLYMISLTAEVWPFYSRIGLSMSLKKIHHG